MAVFQEKIIFGRRRVLNMIFSTLFIYALVVLFLFFNQRSFIYHPARTLPSPEEAGAPEMQLMAVMPRDMERSIQGWYAPPADSEKPVLLYFHGNAGGIDMRVPRILPFIHHGYGVLLAEYRGYGGNPGRPSERAFYADADAYYAWLVDQGITENRIVIYGESIGSGPATYLASRHWDAGGLILDAAFTSLPDIAQKRIFFVPVHLLMLDRYPNIERISEINMPILMMHGEQDNVVNKAFGMALYHAANEPKHLMLFPKGNHSDLYNFGAGQAVLDFLQLGRHKVEQGGQ